MAIFIAFSTLYIVLVARGITVSLLDEGAIDLPVHSGDCRRPPPVCARDLARLRESLDTKSCELQRTGTQAERLWDDWSIGWRRDLAGLEAECCLRPLDAPPDRAPLARAAEDLKQLERLYTTHLVQYAREIGPQSERCQADLDVMAKAQSEGPASSRTPGSP